MQKYKSNITSTSGAAIRNVPVTVLNEASELASLFLDRAGAIEAPNPLATDSSGNFYFYAVNGRYSLRTTVEGVTITDDDVVLLQDPEEITVAGPIAEAVAAAKASAKQAWDAVEESGIPELVAAAQNAVIDSDLALKAARGASQEASEAKKAAEYAQGAAERAKVDAQAASSMAGTEAIQANAAALSAAQSAESIDPAAIYQAIGKKVDAQPNADLMTDAERQKLDTVESGATKNATDAQLQDRSKHTGIQTIATVEGLQEALDASREPLFSIDHHNGPRSSIPIISPGRIPMDGQKLLFSDHPKVCNTIWAGYQNAVDQIHWLANQNCWGKGDGATYVTVPNLNMADGSGKPFYLRGGPDGVNGTWVGDAIRNMKGSAGALLGNSDAFGVFKVGAIIGRQGAYGDVFNYHERLFDASLVVPIADENRVKTAYMVYTVRIFNAVTNITEIDGALLASRLDFLDAELQVLNRQLDCVKIYPNAGTAASPANVVTNTRYMMLNPFPGYEVICVPQLRTADGRWGDATFVFDTSSGGSGVGVNAATYGSDIVVQTGSAALAGGRSSATGDPFGSTTSAPIFTGCRVKVWKIKGGAA